MPVTTTERPTTGRGLLEAVLEKGYFCDVHVRVPTFASRLQAKDIGLQEIPPSVDLGRLILVPHRVMNNFLRISREAYRLSELCGVSMNLPFIRAAFIPAKALPLFIEKLEETREKFEQERRDLYASLDMIRRQVIDNPDLKPYPTLQERLLVKLDEMSKSWVFAIDVNFIELSLPKGLRDAVKSQQSALQEGRAEREAWQELRGEKREAVRKLIDDSKQRLEHDLETLVKDSAQALRTRLVEVAQSVRRHVDRKETIRSDSFQKLSEMLENFEALNAFDDQSIAEEVQRLKALVASTGSAETLTGDHVIQQEFVAAVDALTERIKTADINTVLESFRRKIELE